jgi:hypothetical protein
MSEQRFIQEEQLTTKDLLLRLIGVLRQLVNEWRIILVGMAVGCFLSILYDYKEYQDTTYWAEIHFNLENGGGGGGGLGNFAGMAAAFGIQGGGQQTTDLFSGSNFNIILQSKLLFERAFMKEVTVKGKKMLFANYYKDSSNIAREEWGGTMFQKPNKDAIKYRFIQKNPNDFTPEENEMIQTMFEKLLTGTEIIPREKGSSIMILKGISNNELLSKIWVETLLETLEEFYIEVKTKKTKEILDIQETRLAELSGKLSSTDRQVASTTYQGINAVDPLAPMRTQQVTRNNQFIAQQYFTQLATVENIKLMLLNQTPFFMIVEPVRLPLVKLTFTIGGRTTMGAMFGLVLLCVYILSRNTIRSVIASENEEKN